MRLDGGTRRCDSTVGLDVGSTVRLDGGTLRVLGGATRGARTHRIAPLSSSVACSPGSIHWRVRVEGVARVSLPGTGGEARVVQVFGTDEGESLLRRILVLATLVMALAACGGSSGGGGGNVAAGPAGDPVGAVNNFVNAIKAKSFDKLGPLTCAAKRYDIVGTFTGGSGIPSALLDAMTFDVQNLNAQQTSINGDAAKVHVTGKMVTTVDAAKAKDAVKQLIGSQATDAQVNQMIAAMNQSRDIAEDVDVVKENGGWVVCSNLSVTGG